MNTTAKYKSISDIPTLALRGITVFPGALFHFDVGRQKSIQALEQAMNGGQRIFLITQRDMTTDVPEQKDLFDTGTYCRVRQILKIPGDNIRVLVEGKQRARLDAIRQSRRKHKKLTQEMTEKLCRTFITPLDREDIESLSSALHKVPKTVEKIAERMVLCPVKFTSDIVSKQVSLLDQATVEVVNMVGGLRKKVSVEAEPTVK